MILFLYADEGRPKMIKSERRVQLGNCFERFFLAHYLLQFFGAGEGQTLGVTGVVNV